MEKMCVNVKKTKLMLIHGKRLRKHTENDSNPLTINLKDHKYKE